MKDNNTGKKGIKIDIEGRSPTNHYSDEKTGTICSECYHEVQLAHRFCWYCGCLLSVYAHSGNFEQLANCRNDFQEDEQSGWEEDEE